MTYGIRVLDAVGNASVLTPSIANIVAAGNLTMPNSLNEDYTYGTDINLPVANVSVNDIAVIAYPVKVYFQATIIHWYWAATGAYPFSWYAEPGETYYTKADATGIMTVWPPGTLTMDTAATYDGMCSAFPLAGWDYPNGTTTVSKVRIWAAMSHIVYDASESDFKAVFTIGNKGVESVDYMVFLKNH